MLSRRLGWTETCSSRNYYRTRGLTEAQSRLGDIFTTAAVPGRRPALDVCVASPTQQPEGTQDKQPLIVKGLTTDEKFETFQLKASSIALWSGQRTVDEHIASFARQQSTPLQFSNL